MSSKFSGYSVASTSKFIEEMFLQCFMHSTYLGGSNPQLNSYIIPESCSSSFNIFLRQITHYAKDITMSVVSSIYSTKIEPK